MKNKKLLASAGCLVRPVLTATALMLAANTAYALDPYEPTTTWNVTPQPKIFSDDRVCPAGTTLFKDGFQSVTEGVDEGFFTDSIVIDGITVTMEITTHANNSFDFNIVNGVTRQMFVKGSNFLLYQYDPSVAGATNTGPVSSDTGLHDGVGGSDTQYQDISHLDFCLTPVYPLRADKTAEGSYDRVVTWTLDKSVNPGSHSGNAGEDAGSSTWTVVADKTETLVDFQVIGNITVYNDNVFPVPFTISDVLNDSTVAAVDCSGATEIPATGSLTCSYTADPADASATLNTATIESGIPAVDGATAEAAVSFTENLVGYDSGTLTDARFDYSEVISGDTTVNFVETFSCPADASQYSNGTYSYTETNTATLNGNINLVDSDLVTVDCTLPALVPSKDAAGIYDERHDWSITKSVAGPGAGPFYPGDAPAWNWTIEVIETVINQNFAVAGTISINNPAAIAQSFSVSDVLNDGTLAAVNCPNLTVAPGATETCSYLALPTDAAATLNTVTISAAGNPDQTAQAAVTFIANVINDTAWVSDSEIGLDNVSVSGSEQFTAGDSDFCSSDLADYGTNGTYTVAVSNTATLIDEEGNAYSDDATTSYTCEASAVGLFKTTNGEPADPTKDIAFALISYGTQPPEADPMLRTPTIAEIVSTKDVGAVLDFQTALVPGDVYSICESPVPAGYTFEITVAQDEVVVLTYAGPPGEENPTGEIQCFDLIAAETGGSLTYDVENSFPGGAPRTPGYWKNWNMCSGGQQYETAAKLGGPIEGVFLLEDLLEQQIGDGLSVGTCEEGVLILSARDLEEVDNKDEPVNRSSDAAYTLARALLAARLNQDAGACTADGFDFLGEYGFDGTFEQLLTAADDVLTLVEFTGTGSYLAPQDLRGKNNPLVSVAEMALYLYEIIDDYNNEQICAGEPSH